MAIPIIIPELIANGGITSIINLTPLKRANNPTIIHTTKNM